MPLGNKLLGKGVFMVPLERVIVQ